MSAPHDEKSVYKLAKISTLQKSLFDSYISRRLSHEPIQYIIGEWDFHELPLPISIRKPSLCPRPETEELVELILDSVKNLANPNPQELKILDIGCGTGAIGLALINKLPKSTCVAIDKCPSAINLSNENARKYGFSSRYTAKLVGVEDFDGDGFDIVVSNPPYIPRSDMASLEKSLLEFEDLDALCGGDDGLDIVNLVLDKFNSETQRGLGQTLWMEVDSSHPEMLAGRKGFVGSFKDFNNFDRFVKFERS